MLREDIKERVKEAADIVQIISESVALKRTGSTYRGPCPFHNGKDRNFSVSPKHGWYRCFVCGESGDVFSFVQKRLGLDFPSALRMVAEKSGVEVPRFDPRANVVDPREKQWETLTAASEFFRRVLWEEPAGEPARAYLASRNLDRATADRFGLGYAPDGKGVLSHLRDLGYDDIRLTEVGLLTPAEDNREPSPRFWHRLMIPIFDPANHIVGFGGRTLGSAKPKYLNSPDSPIFSKSKLLYGLNWAKLGIRREAKAILVEGYFDLLRVAAAGVDYVVASMGTALTDAQAHMLGRYAKQVLIAYDSDEPGLRATFKAAKALLEHGLRVRVVTLPKGDDPDTFVAAHGRAGFESELDHALDVFDRMIQFLERNGWFTDLDRKRRAIDSVLPTIRVTADPITRQLYVGRLAEASGVSADALWREIGGDDAPEPSIPVESKPVRAQKPASAQAAKREGGAAAERLLVRSVLAARSLLETVAEHVDGRLLRDPQYRAIFDALLLLGPDATLDELATQLSVDDVDLMQTMLAEAATDADPKRVVDDSLARLIERDSRERRNAIRRQMEIANPAEKSELLDKVFKNKSTQRRRGAS